MTEADLQQIEQHLGFPLPSAYRETALSYPFDAHSYPSDCMLANSAQGVIGLNSGHFSAADIAKAFFVGSDGSEERYFLDGANAGSPVFCYEVESGRHRVHSASWPEYLDRIRVLQAELDAEEAEIRLEREETLHHKPIRKWWQFWA